MADPPRSVHGLTSGSTCTSSLAEFSQSLGLAHCFVMSLCTRSDSFSVGSPVKRTRSTGDKLRPCTRTMNDKSKLSGCVVACAPAHRPTD